MSRFEKSKDIVRLALMMSASREGVSLREIQSAFHISRRTAERMRDAILDLFPGDAVRETVGDDRIKRWALQTGSRNQVAIDDLISFTPDELSYLEMAARVLARDGMSGGATAMMNMRDKLRSLMRPERLTRLDPDIEALVEAEGIAMRPGPRPKIDGNVVSGLRDAILMSKKIVVYYRARGSRTASRQLVHPYGFLYGNRNYLVAYNENHGVEDIRLFSLSNISRVDLLDDSFELPSDFSLQDYASRSFGVFQEDPFDVVLRFSPDAAEDVHQFMFHPTQTMEDEQDGSVVVQFHAGGALEMVWHLFTWGDSVEIIAPKKLQDLMHECCGWGEKA